MPFANPSSGIAQPFLGLMAHLQKQAEWGRAESCAAPADENCIIEGQTLDSMQQVRKG